MVIPGVRYVGLPGVQEARVGLEDATDSTPPPGHYTTYSSDTIHNNHA